MCVCTHAFKLLLTFSCQSSSDIIILPEVYQTEGFSNCIKIKRMVSNYFCSCNLEQLKMSLKKSGTRTCMHTYTHMHTHMHTRMHTHTHTHVHIHTYILTSWTKVMVRKNRCPLAKWAWFEDASIHKKSEQNFKRSTTCYTKADNTLYSTNSHF